MVRRNTSTDRTQPSPQSVGMALLRRIDAPAECNRLHVVERDDERQPQWDPDVCEFVLAAKTPCAADNNCPRILYCCHQCGDYVPRKVERMSNYEKWITVDHRTIEPAVTGSLAFSRSQPDFSDPNALVATCSACHAESGEDRFE